MSQQQQPQTQIQGASLPRMVDMDWRMDVKTSSDVMSRMAVPTVLFKLQVEDPKGTPSEDSQQPATKTVIFELNKQTINTMLEGLEFVQGQLNSIK
ncbi:hypothetical protein SAMD00019534_108000 [Acytostelium subglobosum LB1]|uniref:hypothetical protein n=1 Tax=Acytostelium subglobosum LB1 TaxID=1410327 RepID=UPI000644C5C7|nr:hypothetical protein SAMD00019534_108000 [Acytostelium subglobosum LB1]GAM27624.1 hypothetical protein SAMD00019534_108000 [Acytostelium subglobosum LB1]|eukprot:XP_012749283.1 hypothetical protein SAMD00019534_108000 [Acytostelium subglobosum LB1]